MRWSLTGNHSLICILSQTLDTQGLLDPSDSSLDFVARRENVRPVTIYRIEEFFLLCYAGMLSVVAVQVVNILILAVSRIRFLRQQDGLARAASLGDSMGRRAHVIWYVLRGSHFCRLSHLEFRNSTTLPIHSGVRAHFRGSPTCRDGPPGPDHPRKSHPMSFRRCPAFANTYSTRTSDSISECYRWSPARRFSRALQSKSTSESIRASSPSWPATTPDTEPDHLCVR